MVAAAIFDFCTNTNNSAVVWVRLMKFCRSLDSYYRKYAKGPKVTIVTNSRWRRLNWKCYRLSRVSWALLKFLVLCIIGNRSHWLYHFLISSLNLHTWMHWVGLPALSHNMISQPGMDFLRPYSFSAHCCFLFSRIFSRLNTDDSIYKTLDKEWQLYV